MNNTSTSTVRHFELNSALIFATWPHGHLDLDWHLSVFSHVLTSTTCIQPLTLTTYKRENRTHVYITWIIHHVLGLMMKYIAWNTRSSSLLSRSVFVVQPLCYHALVQPNAHLYGRKWPIQPKHYSCTCRLVYNFFRIKLCKHCQCPQMLWKFCVFQMFLSCCAPCMWSTCSTFLPS